MANYSFYEPLKLTWGKQLLYRPLTGRDSINRGNLVQRLVFFSKFHSSDTVINPEWQQ